MSVPGVLPPSPPSTSSRRKLRLPKSLVHSTDAPDSPASFAGSSNTRTRKRVEFSPWTNAHEPPSSSSQPPSTLLPVKSLPPSSECPSSLKSILKPVVAEDKMPQPVGGRQDVDRSIGEMMGSIIQQLSQDDRSISVDAYQTLASVIREYDEIPEEAVLKNKINTVLKYVKRDLLRQVKPDEPQIADTNVMTQALKVLVIFVWRRDYASLLSDEYRAFILDRSIQVITEHTAPKSVIIHYLHLLATQDFRPGLVTSNNRIGRLLEALKALTEYVKGNGAVSERLLVYQKLLDQAKPVMKAKANLWVEELLTGMTSSLKDIRTKAMMLGMKSCSAFPASSSISTAVRSVMGRELEPNKTFNSAMCRRLEKMISSKEEALQVPQIWAIVLLLSNGADTRIENWPELKDLLKVIQRCFNCSESAIRQQANMAWNRFVYIVRPHDTSETLMAMLAKPLAAQLERQGTEKTVKGSRPTAVSSYCNLLYYAFRPAASHKQYTRVWNEYVVKVMKSSFFEKNNANSDLSCRVFIALLWNASTSTKVWNENRALENTPIEPEELPTIDCKWIRSRSASIIDMFRVLLRYSSWGASGESERAYIAVAWTHFLKALRESSSKEIKPSLETKHAVTGVVDFLGQLWTDSRQEVSGPYDHDHSVSSPQKRQMTRIAVHELDHMLILTGIENGSVAPRKTPILMAIFDSIASDLKQLEEPSDMRSHLPTSRSTLPTLQSQSEKCLELLNSLVIQDLKSEMAINPATMGENLEILQHVLQQTAENHRLGSLNLLSTSLAILLKDESHRLGGPEYHKFSNTVVKLLAEVPFTAVQLFDSLFAAPFESSHVWVVKNAVKMWSKQFSQHVQLTPGTCLSKALLKLENLVDTGVPVRVRIAEGATGFDEPLPALEESTTPVSSRHASMSPNDDKGPGDASPLLGSQVGRFVDAEATGDIASSPERPSSRPRSRHNDSQIDFVAINSSPPLHDEPESQYLTAHQKEVRERQRSEPAVVFPDLRSSPRQPGKSQSQSDCEFARKAAALAERPSTPTLPTHQDQGEPEIMASPTPRARQFTQQITDLEVPSSPPSMLDNQGKEAGKLELSSPLQKPADDAEIGIDLAIPQPDDPSVEPMAEEIEEEGHMAVDHAENATKLRLIAVAEDEVESQKDRRRDRRRTARPVDAPPKTQPADFAPSTVPETMLTSDENGQEHSQSHIGDHNTDSDEIDMLSASQLSQDLDRHLSQTVDDIAIQIAGEASGVQPSNHEGDRQLSKPDSRHLRKRKSSNLTAPSSKRRRSKALSQLSSASFESQMSSMNGSQTGEIFDTIEVMAIQPVAACNFAEETRSAPSKAEQPPKRRRGKRRSARNRSQEHAKPAVEVVVSTRRPEAACSIDATAVQSQEVDAGLRVQQIMPCDSPVVAVEQAPAPKAVMAMEEGRTVAEASAQVETGEGSCEADIVSSLQAILDRLKATRPEKLDLRALDDLCFQIRFQAQVVTQRQIQ
ncbi:hypothetical protein A1O3_08854 [Capronia epimyces CBS 606.96]|uniref:Telomere-associated protein Rif1 N-terminal domain-containing protein n=1 Tax=Capronia epimyces CBS 606.96 TaxID=1182542 RepID=W9XFV1_9EURO|nr:uncharacterized protein A1O3_08854 [Capronia epimyces CBS 606.96]EXJ79352.1 hypothetical protein A1O3_08854 [Capronia epimyces CBS 606.96]